MLVPQPLPACIWDSDTLAAEAKGLPGVAYIITGRFERNPPYYYEIRLERATADVAKDPDNWGAYDDAGVACDRLGRGDEAIAWMERKRERLDKADATNATIRDHRYLYLAYLGSFWAHRWFRQGADRNRIQDMKKGRDFTNAAIDLNPDAHFGRERYQLMYMDWIIDPPDLTGEKVYILPSFLDQVFRQSRSERWSFRQAEDAVTGLCGLISLGEAWQSVDIFRALHIALLEMDQKSATAYTAHLRCIELIDQGRGSILPGAPKGEELKASITRSTAEFRRHQHQLDQLDQDYHRLRAAADKWHGERTKYMMDRLEAGRHPDTDPTFWADYKDSSPPPLPGQLGVQIREQLPIAALAAGIMGMVVLVTGATLFVRRRLRARQMV
jgi:hypothetical protein